MRTDRKLTNMAQNILFVIIKQCFGHIFVSESKKRAYFVPSVTAEMASEGLTLTCFFLP